MDLHESALEDDEMLMCALAMSITEEDERVQKDLSMASGASGGSVSGNFAFSDDDDDEFQLALAVSLSLAQEEPSQPTKPEGECSRFRHGINQFMGIRMIFARYKGPKESRYCCIWNGGCRLSFVLYFLPLL